MQILHIDAWVALGVFLATAATDAIYVLFTAAVSARRGVPAATWSAVWYLLSSFAVINYTRHWTYVLFAAAGSWVGAFTSIHVLKLPVRKNHPAAGCAAEGIAPAGDKPAT